jgi:hypothetical protein
MDEETDTDTDREADRDGEMDRFKFKNVLTIESAHRNSFIACL